jgi:adenine deaminase
MDLNESINAALGNEPIDLLLKDGKLVNVVSGEIYQESVGVHNGRVIGFGDYEAKEVVDVGGKYVAPGFIDGHLHLESTMLSVPEFARHVIPFGTTAVVADPHEIANVKGLEGIQYILDTSEGLPLSVFIMFPSCVPATPFETSGAQLNHEDMKPFVNHPRILGLAEVMNFPGVLMADPEILAKLKVFEGKVIDGHSPGLSGKSLSAYLAAGIGSDHECVSKDEALEKLRSGMRIMIREGSAAKNLEALLPMVNKTNSRNCMFVTDDMDPNDIKRKGHLNSVLRKAVSLGLDPVTAIQMATINPAQYFGLTGMGAILPGYVADMVVLDNPEDARVSRVYKAGRLVAENGEIKAPCLPAKEAKLSTSVVVDWDKVTDFSLNASGTKANIIGVTPGEIVTKRIIDQAPRENGKVVQDIDSDILKIAVIERHKGSGAYSVGLIKGFGLKKGAIACTVAHDSHNIIVVGANDSDMYAAAKEIAAMGGGMLVMEDGRIKAQLPLPIAGLMSDQPLERVAEDDKRISEAAQDLGCRLEAPFATLSFMALTPIPEIKITDQGLFDSLNFKFLSLFEE